jgi:hypothetical protein
MLGFGFQKYEMAAKGMGRVDVCRDFQLILVKWDSKNVRFINIAFKSEVYSAIRIIDTPPGTGVPFKTVEQL